MPLAPYPFAPSRIQASPPDTAGLIVRGACWYHGASLIETAGVAATTLTIFDAESAVVGQRIDCLRALLNGSDHSTFAGISGIYCERGIFVVSAGGTPQFNIRYTPGWLLDHSEAFLGPDIVATISP